MRQTLRSLSHSFPPGVVLYRLPTTNYQLPTTNYQLPTTNYHTPNYHTPNFLSTYALFAIASGVASLKQNSGR